LRSPLPNDLHHALVVAAGPDVPLADTDPLDFFDFYRVDP
jgi:hypothetical protein